MHGIRVAAHPDMRSQFRRAAFPALMLTLLVGCSVHPEASGAARTDAVSDSGASAIWSSDDRGFSLHVNGGLQGLDHTYDYTSDTHVLAWRCDRSCYTDGGYQTPPVEESMTLDSAQVSNLMATLTSLRAPTTEPQCVLDAFAMTLTVRGADLSTTDYAGACATASLPRVDQTELDNLYRELTSYFPP